MVEVYTCMGSYASLLAQQQDGRLMPEDTLHMAVRAKLVAILTADEALYDLGTFAFIISHLFITGRRHVTAISELLHLI